MARLGLLLLALLLIVDVSDQLKKSKKTSKNAAVEEVRKPEQYYRKMHGGPLVNRTYRAFPKGHILTCMAKCVRIPTCTCARLSKSTNKCDVHNADGVDFNSEHSDDYVYFTPNEFGDSIGQENLARGKRVSQSSTYNQYKGNKAVDGRNKTQSKTNTRPPKGALPWLQIDLGGQFIITGVAVMSADAHYLHDFEVRVGNNKFPKTDKTKHFTSNSLCAKYDGENFMPNNVLKSLECGPCPVIGQYVSVQIIRNCATCEMRDTNILDFSEIEVYGFSVVTN